MLDKLDKLAESFEDPLFSLCSDECVETSVIDDFGFCLKVEVGD
jgi:hypothetical protein